MNEPTSKTSRQTQIKKRHYSPSAEVHIIHAMHPVVQAIIVLGMLVAIGLGMYGAIKGSIAERESRLQRLEIDEMKIALQVQGIKVHEGSTP